MEFFKIKRDIPFMRHALIFNAVSFITFFAAVFFLFSRGLHLSVEFTGGTLMEVSFSQPVALDPVRARIAALGYTDVQVQNFGSARDVLIRMPAAKGSTATEQSERVMATLKETDAQAELKRTEFVGPQVGDELAIDGLKALAFVVVGIMITWPYVSSGNTLWPASSPTCTTSSSFWVSSLTSNGSFRFLCWLPCWRCWAIR